MKGLAFYCCLSAALYALIGMSLGIYMAAGHDYVLAPAHTHLNLLGWVSMAVHGLFYHAVPIAALSPLARIQVAVATLGIWLLVPGIALTVLGRSEGMAVAGSLLTILAMALFTAVIAASRRLISGSDMTDRKRKIPGSSPGIF